MTNATMIKIERNDKMAKAIERAKSSKLHVRRTAERTYEVQSGPNTYTVKFLKVNNLKLASCSCPATTMCKHIPSALALHSALVSGFTKEAAPAASPRTKAELIESIKTAWTARYGRRYDLGQSLLKRFGHADMNAICQRALESLLHAIA
jgi:hypothetical protein